MAEGPVVTVCYYNGKFTLPPGHSGHPADRYASTDGDNLIELAGRTSYDSTHKKKARPTPAYHAHLRESGHTSVLAHAVAVFEATHPQSEFMLEVVGCLHCRPGVWVTRLGQHSVRFAVSLRAVVEWLRHGPEAGDDITRVCLGDRANRIYRAVVRAVAPDFPLALADDLAMVNAKGAGRDDDLLPTFKIRRVTPELPKEKWVSLFVEGVSRRLLQELVRHHWQANPSVRSTRYVDESGSTQIVHPAIIDKRPVVEAAEVAWAEARKAYAAAYDALKAYGVDDKTARGAAGGLLPEATETRLVFSMSEFQAAHMLNLRLKQTTGKADPEIVRFAAVVADVLRSPPVAWPL